ncbi:MAG: UDP-N-acetylmuramoyl-tripeptide--D-alanyl-D-alanine ligase [Ignavibacteriales bacterium]|nr:UDP-N-acetylmuramoyl-tripeptide--D-alanyl-D-alanine ligase [Ignavibacteriales bacterium]
MLFVDDLLKISNAEAINVEQFSREPFLGVSTDSRTINDGQIFLALRGDKFDGHNFVEEVISKGIRIAIVEENWFRVASYKLRGFQNVGFVLVDNTTKAFGELANIWRKKFDIPILVITGSNGKTTTKEMLTQVLQTQYNVHSTQANDNNHIGVPKTLFGINKETEIAVLELGSNHIGEISYLSNIVSPTHSLVTNIGKEHLEFFGSLENIAKEETTTFSNSLFGFVNEDDEEIKKRSFILKKKKTYGFQNNVDVAGNIVNVDESGCVTFSITNDKLQITNCKLQIAGIHNASNALASATVGKYFGISSENIKSSLENFRAYDKRMEILKANGITIINDTYNSNPDSVIAALHTLQQMKTSGKKIIVLGDMLEFGNTSEAEHRQIGRIISEMGFKNLFTFGVFSKYISAETNQTFVKHFNDKQKLISELKNSIQTNDIILIKGSRGMKMEEIVQGLTVIASVSEETPKKIASLLHSSQ